MKRHSKRLILAAAIAGLTGCQTPIAPRINAPDLAGTPTSGSAILPDGAVAPIIEKGTLDVSIRWPERSYPNFQAQAIPVSTTLIVLSAYVDDRKIDEITFERPQSSNEASRGSLTLDAGLVRLEARAYRDETLIAEGSTTVTVKASVRAPARITLGPLFAPKIISLSSYGGAQGDLLTILGENFGDESLPVPEIHFNGVRASAVTRSSGGQLEVRIPSGSTTGLITIKTDGISSSSEVVFWVADAIAIDAPKADWDPSPATQRTVLFNDTLQLTASPRWVFAPGESPVTHGVPPDVLWELSTPAAGTLDGKGRFTAGNAFQRSTVRARLGSLESPELLLSPEEVTAFSMEAERTILGGKGDLSTPLRAVNTLSSGATTSAAVLWSDDPARISVREDGQAQAEDFGFNGAITVRATSGLRPGRSASVTLELANYALSTFAGGEQDRGNGEIDGPLASVRFRSPGGIAVAPDDAMYITDEDYNSVRKIHGGQVETLIRQTSDQPFGGVSGIAVGPADSLYVPNRNYTSGGGSEPSGMRLVRPDGSLTYLEGSYNGPHGVAVDQTGNLIYIESHRIRKRSPEGVFTSYGSFSEPGFRDGQASAARFDSPLGVAADPHGNIYVLENGNHSVRKIAPDGTVSTLAGTGSHGFRDGPAAQAQFSFPQGLAIDASGNVYVTDLGNYRIRKITPRGEVMTIAGNGSAGSTDGIGTNAQIGLVSGIARDSRGRLYFLEWLDAADDGLGELKNFRKIRMLE